MSTVNLKAGDDHTLEITTGEDLTGATAITWRLATPGGVLAVSKDLDGGVTVQSPPTDGIVEVRLDSADTLALKGPYRHETEVFDADGDKATVSYDSQSRFYGTIIFEAERF